MATTPIVKPIDVVRHIGIGRGPRRIPPIVDPFDLERADGFKSFTRRNFRSNLAQRTGGAVADAHAHHIFPQKFRQQFEAAGLNINDPQLGAWWKATDHLSNAGRYNDEWADFLSTERSREDIMRFGRTMAERYGLDISF